MRRRAEPSTPVARRLRALAARARAAHSAGRIAERNRACAEHDRLWLETYGPNRVQPTP